MIIWSHALWPQKRKYRCVENQDVGMMYDWALRLFSGHGGRQGYRARRNLTKGIRDMERNTFTGKLVLYYGSTWKTGPHSVASSICAGKGTVESNAQSTQSGVWILGPGCICGMARRVKAVANP